MNVQQLRCVAALADHGAVTKAARALNVSQPSVSQAIHSLEEELGTALVQRSGRTLVFTEAGEVALVAIRRALSALDMIRPALDKFRGPTNLRIAASHSMLPMLSKRIGKITQLYPDLRVEAFNVTSDTALADALLSGKADVGFGDLANAPAALDRKVTGQTELVLISPIGTSLPDTVTFTDLNDLPMCTPFPTDGRQGLDAIMAKAGAHLKVIFETEEANAFIHAVQSGIGSALGWRPLVADTPNVEIRPFTPIQTIETGFLYLPAPSRVVQDFLALPGAS